MDSSRIAPSRRPAASIARSGVEGSALRRPFRFWMTGSLAVVMAALAPARAFAEADVAEPERVLRISRYGVAETAQRIQAAARGHGLSVLVRCGGDRPAIVLAASIGGTLVVMDEASDRLDIPFCVRLQQRPPGDGADGGVAVCVGAARGLEGRWGDLPPGVAADLAALPTLIDLALG